MIADAVPELQGVSLTRYCPQICSGKAEQQHKDADAEKQGQQRHISRHATWSDATDARAGDLFNVVAILSSVSTSKGSSSARESQKLVLISDQARDSFKTGRGQAILPYSYICRRTSCCKILACNRLYCHRIVIHVSQDPGKAACPVGSIFV